MNKTSCIFGVTGQDGSFMSELLLDQGHKVIGVARRTSTDNTERISHLFNNSNFSLVEGDITDSGFISNLISTNSFNFIVNLAAMSHVGSSFSSPQTTFDINVKGVCNILEAIRFFAPSARFLQASSSEMFGNNYVLDSNGKKCQNDSTAFSPRSPYGVSKLCSHELVRVYRESYKLHLSCSICYNHESRRRGDKFVTKKICKWLQGYRKWRMDYNHFPIDFDEDIIRIENISSYLKLRLGNTSSYRDFSHAKDMVRGMWLMLQQDQPDDYILASGTTHSITEFLQKAFAYVGIDDYNDYVFTDPEFFRPSEVDFLCGKSNKARDVLGWSPEISFEELVEDMVQGDRYGSKEASNRQEKISQKV